MEDFRFRLKRIIFGTDTPAGKAFDILLLITIIFSIVIVCLESMPNVFSEYTELFISLEWIITAIFLVEYITRIWVSDNKIRYVTSLYGIIDLVSTIPSFIGLFLPQSYSLTLVRAIRLMRIFRILKLVSFLEEVDKLKRMIKASGHRIIVFLTTISCIVLILGSTMYWVEGPENGFVSIPTGIYWAIVTMTTVGYGDVVASSPLGKVIASLMMIIGYSIIALPAGLVSTERRGKKTVACSRCALKKHSKEANYCCRCGEKLSWED